MRDTRRAAEYLFDEIGGIDDSYIAAAQSAGKAKTRMPFRAGLVAAAALLVMTVTVVLPMGLYTRGDKEASDDGIYDQAIGTKPTYDGNQYGPTEDANKKDDESQESVYTLDGVLNVSQDRFYVGDTLDLFDGTPRLLWQASDGALCGVNLSAAELEHLDRESGRGEQIGDTELEAEIQVWISYGNGIVISPYLEDSPGNVGYGDLFDYSPEIIPSSAVTGRIKNIIAHNT